MSARLAELSFPSRRTRRAAAYAILLGAGLLLPVSLVAEPIGAGLGPALAGFLRSDLGLFLQLALSTLASEDLACIGGGVLVASGRATYALAAAACFSGIFLGDLLLFAAGRVFGRRLLGFRVARRFVSVRDVERSAAWLESRGTGLILVSRFLPGTRLPTYLAAGMLGTSVWRFAGAFALAAAVWTPALVWLSAWLGAEALESALATMAGAGVAVAVAGFFALVGVRLALVLARPQSRRRVRARLQRVARWEFWPPWMFYPPVVAYIVWLGLRNRGLGVFTAANPAIPDGGFVGESKFGILSSLTAAPERVARTVLLPGKLSADSRLEIARDFMAANELTFPVVLKPDVGQRGDGVEIVRCGARMAASIAGRRGDIVLQAYAAGHEFGVFWVRRPGESRGWIASITEKRFPEVTGDGRSTLGELIDADDRAVLMRRAYGASLGDRIAAVPGAGETVRLVELGSHCRGAVFLDGSWVWTEALERAFDRVAGTDGGICFGRYDVRVESIEAFQRGEGFTVVELNGVTAEATHIYDPRTRLTDAYRVIFGQWRTAFEIGAANRDRGAKPASAWGLAQTAVRFLASGVRGRGNN